MAKHAQRITSVLGSALVSSIAWSGGAPVDEDLISDPSEAPVTTFIASCSPVGTPATPLAGLPDLGTLGCQEQLLDLNGDGDADLFMGIGISSPARNKFYAGRGSGLFQSAVYTGPVAGTSTSDIKFADLDGDGDVDMVESTRGGVNNIYVNTNPGSGAASFAAAQQIDARTDRTSSIAIGDVDNDGDLDIVFSNEGTGAGGATTQSNLVYENQSTTADTIVFGSAIELDAMGSTAYTRRVVLFDADGDGDLDIIATSASAQTDGTGTGNLIYVNQTIGGGGGFGFAAGTDLTPGLADDATDEANSIAVGDINGDSVPDLVFSVWQGANRYYINSGGGDFDTSGTFGGAEQTSHVRLADVDADGDLDAVVTTYEGDNLVHLNTIGSTGTGFTAGSTIEDPTDDPAGSTTIGFDQSRHLGVSDLNADGFLDLIVANRDQLDLRFLNNQTCTTPANETCHPFQNQGQTINSQTTNPVNITPDQPYDMLDALAALDVDDADNVYPADHSVRITEPTAGDHFTCETPPTPPGTFCVGTVIIPEAMYTGPITVDMRTTDGFNTSQSWPLAMMVAATGGSPTFTSTPVLTASEGIVYTYNITAQDPDGDSLVIDTPPASPLPAWLTLTDHGNRTATLTGTPGDTDLGDHDVTIRINDGNGNTVTQPFTITVSAGAPTFTSTPLTAATEGVVYTYNITASDPNGDTMTIAYDAGSDMPAWLTLTDNMDGTATLTGTPAGTDIGAYDIVLIVTDTTPLSVTQPFTITVASAADAPTITLSGDNPLVLTQGDTFVEPGFTANDAQDGDITTSVVVTGNVDTSTVGDYLLTYTVEDSAGNQAQVTRDVEVQAAGGGGTTNTDPVLTSPGNQTARVGQAFTLNLASNASDADGDTLTFTATGLPSSLTLTSGGTLSGTLVAVDTNNSPYTVNVTVDDGNGGTDSVSFMLTVNAAVSGGGGSSGGGGAFGLLELLVLLGGAAAAGLRRRLAFGRA